MNRLKFSRHNDGSPLTANNPVLLASAVCTGDVSFSFYNSSTGRLCFYYTFSWSSMPFQSHTDIMALNWVAVNPSAVYISSSAFAKYAHVNYYNTTTGSFYETTSLSLKTTSDFNGYYAEYDPIISIPEQSDGSMVAWAKSGKMTITIEPDGNAVINLIKAYGAIGHQVVCGSTNVGFSTDGTSHSFSFSITPADKYNTVGISSKTIKNTGECTSN